MTARGSPVLLEPCNRSSCRRTFRDSGTSPHEKACALVAHVGADLAKLGTAAGIEMPTAKSVEDTLSVVGHKRDDVRTAIHDLYLNVRDPAGRKRSRSRSRVRIGSDARRDGAFAHERGTEVHGEQFEQWRLGNAFEWLGDLDAVLPARSAAGVRASLRALETWVSKRTRSDGTVDPAKVDEFAMRALRRQGDMWRRLLTGEQVADQLLDTKAYVRAGSSLLANARRGASPFTTSGSGC